MAHSKPLKLPKPHKPLMVGKTFLAPRSADSPSSDEKTTSSDLRGGRMATERRQVPLRVAAVALNSATGHRLSRCFLLEPRGLMNNLDLYRSQPRDSKIRIHGREAFEGMRRAGQLASHALDMLVEHVTPGITTEQLDDLVVEFAHAHDAIPAPLNYRGFPKAICTSINHVVCHGIPNAKPLKEGDIVNIDVTLILDGWHGDTSRMYTVGHVSR